jgi:hypothetical protein
MDEVSQEAPARRVRGPRGRRDGARCERNIADPGVQDSRRHWTRTFEWTIEKSVSPDSWDLETGQSGTSTYTVDVTKSAPVDSICVSGEVCVENVSATPTENLMIVDRLQALVSEDAITLASVPLDMSLNPVLDPGERRRHRDRHVQGTAEARLHAHAGRLKDPLEVRPGAVRREVGPDRLGRGVLLEREDVVPGDQHVVRRRERVLHPRPAVHRGEAQPRRRRELDVRRQLGAGLGGRVLRHLHPGGHAVEGRAGTGDRLRRHDCRLQRGRHRPRALPGLSHWHPSERREPRLGPSVVSPARLEGVGSARCLAGNWRARRGRLRPSRASRSSAARTGWYGQGRARRSSAASQSSSASVRIAGQASKFPA